MLTFDQLVERGKVRLPSQVVNFVIAFFLFNVVYVTLTGMKWFTQCGTYITSLQSLFPALIIAYELKQIRAIVQQILAIVIQSQPKCNNMLESLIVSTRKQEMQQLAIANQKTEDDNEIQPLYIDKTRIFDMNQKFVQNLQTSDYLGINEKIPHIGFMQRYPIDKQLIQYFQDIHENDIFQMFPDIQNYRRVNCEADLRIQYMKKFDCYYPPLSSSIKNQIDMQTKMIIKKMKISEKLAYHLKCQYEDTSFDMVIQRADLNTSAGIPYEFQGFKTKRSALDQAVIDANRMFYDNNYRQILWGIGTRGKLRYVDQPDSARCVEYPPVDYSFVGMKWTHPVQDHWKTFLYQCPIVIGHSWAYGHTRDLVDYFERTLQASYQQIEFMNLDMSSFDASVDAYFLQSVCKIHQAMIKRIPSEQLPKFMKSKFIQIIEYGYQQMINAHIVLPESGHIIELKRGMKSGWMLTALDNSITHMIMFEIVKQQLCLQDKVCYVVYGDDILIGQIKNKHTLNLQQLFMDIKGVYAQMNITVRDDYGYGSLFDVFFLSKQVMVDEYNMLQVSRPTIDSLVRMIYPDCYQVDTSVKGINFLLCRAIGHYLDNWNNKEFRNICIQLIQYFVKLYDIKYISPEKTLARIMRDFGLTNDEIQVQMLEETAKRIYVNIQQYTYKVQFTKINDTFLNNEYPDFNVQNLLDYTYYYKFITKNMKTYRKICNENHELLDSHVTRKRYRRNLGPIKIPADIKGMSGLRLLEIISMSRTLQQIQNEKTSKVLLIGCHPGADINAVGYTFKDTQIYGVSIYPQEDIGKLQFNYKVTDQYIRDRMHIKQGAYPKVNYDEIRDFDVVHLDAHSGQYVNSIDTYSDPDASYELFSEHFEHVSKHHPKAIITFKLNGLSPRFIEWFFDILNNYPDSGFKRALSTYPNYFDIVGYVNLAEKSNNVRPLKKKRYMTSVYKWWNDNVTRILQNEIILNEAIRNRQKLLNPLQNDRNYQIWFRQQISTIKSLGPFGVIREVFSYLRPEYQKNMICPEFIARKSTRGKQAVFLSSQLRRINAQEIIEFGCGVGCQTLKFLQDGLIVEAFDHDTLILKYLMHNARIAHLQQNLKCDLKEWNDFYEEIILQQNKYFNNNNEKILFLDPLWTETNTSFSFASLQFQQQLIRLIQMNYRIVLRAPTTYNAPVESYKRIIADCAYHFFNMRFDI